MLGNVLTNRNAIDRSKTDFYPTPKEVTIALLKYLKIPKQAVIWEPACGEGHMAEAIKELGYKVISSDINNMGYGEVGIDYLTTPKRECDWIITNPPFCESVNFIKTSITYGVPFALLLKSQYWHTRNRLEMFYGFKPKAVLPLTWRPDFLFGKKGGAPTMDCIWTVWDSIPSNTTEYLLLEKPLIKPPRW